MTRTELVDLLYELADECQARGMAQDPLPSKAEMLQVLIDDPEMGAIVDIFAGKIQRA